MWSFCWKIFLTSFQGYEVIYLFGTTLSDEKISLLTDRLKETERGTKVITVSFPLESPHFEVMSVISCPFDFGKTDVYLHIRV